MADIFICHSQSDEDRARQVSGALQQLGWTTEMHAGASGGADDVRTAYEASKCMLVLWSPASRASRPVVDVARRGLTRGNLIQVRLEESSVPAEFGTCQHADLTDWVGKPDGGQWARLLLGVAAHAGQPTLKLPPISISRLRAAAEAPRPIRPFSRLRDIEAAWCPEMVVIPGGEFQMGSNVKETGRYGDERPQHRVVISKTFALSKSPVTFEAYDAYCTAAGIKKPDDRGWGRGRRPVIMVSWYEAAAYCRWLSEKTGHHYRLPTEAEWEYCCRSDGSQVYKGLDIDGLSSMAWFARNSGERTQDTGTRSPSAWGLHDMLGNVWEWCADDARSYGGGTETDPMGPRNSDNRVLRGGSWRNGAKDVRATCRIQYERDHRNDVIGFRCVREIK